MAIVAKYNKRLGINVDDKTYEEVKRLADDQGVSNAEIIRKAIEAGLPVIRHDATESPPVRG